MEQQMSPAQEVKRWKNRIVQSKRQRNEDSKIRKKFVKWYSMKYYPGGVSALDEREIGKRQTPYLGMFSRHLQANLYAQAPLYTCSSPWNIPPINQLIGRIANKIPDHVGLKKVIRPALLDLVVGRFTVAQVGYEAQFGWDATSADRERQKAQEESQRMMMGEEVAPKEMEDHLIHLEEHGADLQRAQAQQQQDAVALLTYHMEETRKLKDEQLASPYEYVKDKSVWVCRVPPAIKRKTAFGWEVDAPFEESRWCWSYSVKTIEELQADEYLENTANLEPTHFRKDAIPEEEFDALDDREKDAYDDGKGLVGVYRVVDRQHGDEIIFSENGDEPMKKEEYTHADLFRGMGIHVFALEPGVDEVSGKAPAEDAAGAINTVNHTNGMLNELIPQSAASKLYNLSKISSEDMKRFQRRELGEAIGIKFKGDIDDIRKHLVDMPGVRLPMENLAGFTEAKEIIGAALGIGDPGLGGTDVSQTATASFASSSSHTGNLEGWGRGLGEWVADITVDAFQVVKVYYDDEEAILKLVGAEDGPAYQELRKRLKPWPEILKAKVGSTMPGRKQQEREDAMTLFQTTAGHPLVEQRTSLEDLYVAFDKDPDRFVISPDKERERAQGQPGSQNEMVGEPGVVPDDGSRPSEAETPDDLQREVRSQAAVHSAEAAAR